MYSVPQFEFYKKEYIDEIFANTEQKWNKILYDYWLKNNSHKENFLKFNQKAERLIDFLLKNNTFKNDLTELNEVNLKRIICFLYEFLGNENFKLFFGTDMWICIIVTMALFIFVLEEKNVYKGDIETIFYINIMTNFANNKKDIKVINSIVAPFALFKFISEKLIIHNEAKNK